MMRTGIAAIFDNYIRYAKKNTFFSVWITGSTNHRASNITDHAASELHKVLVIHLRTGRAKAANLL